MVAGALVEIPLAERLTQCTRQFSAILNILVEESCTDLAQARGGLTFHGNEGDVGAGVLFGVASPSGAMVGRIAGFDESKDIAGYPGGRRSASHGIPVWKE